MSLVNFFPTRFIGMGILNLTPDSFSDGDIHLTPAIVAQKIAEYSNFEGSILDIGAQSTAPFNPPISAEEEVARFERLFFTCLEAEGAVLPRILSIDTYRASTFKHVYRRIKSLRPDVTMIWNDISGVLDQELWRTLGDDCPEARYIHTHTLVKERERAWAHMDKVMDCTPAQTADWVADFFRLSMQEFKRRGLEERILLDPGFGFSKTLEQNCAMLGTLGRLFSGFPYEQAWALGISRKSFLRFIAHGNTEKRADYATVDELQVNILREWKRQYNKNLLVIRLHDLGLFKQALLPDKSI